MGIISIESFKGTEEIKEHMAVVFIILAVVASCGDIFRTELKYF